MWLLTKCECKNKIFSNFRTEYINNIFLFINNLFYAYLHTRIMSLEHTLKQVSQCFFFVFAETIDFPVTRSVLNIPIVFVLDHKSCVRVRFRVNHDNFRCCVGYNLSSFIVWTYPVYPMFWYRYRLHIDTLSFLNGRKLVLTFSASVVIW